MKRLEALDGKVSEKVTPGDLVNGNALEDRTAVASVIDGLDWKSGQTLYLVWTPTEARQNRIGIDGLVISAEAAGQDKAAGFTGQYEENFDVLMPRTGPSSGHLAGAPAEEDPHAVRLAGDPHGRSQNHQPLLGCDRWQRW